MKTIYKYELKIEDRQIIKLPDNAKILSTQFQNNKLCLWAMVETTNEESKRVIRIFGTGNKIDRVYYQMNYIGTVQKDAYVLHVFEDMTGEADRQ